MKRRDLERHLRAHDARVVREGGRHAIWGNEDKVAAVPRHNEIKFTVARAICKDLGVPMPKGK